MRNVREVDEDEECHGSALVVATTTFVLDHKTAGEDTVVSATTHCDGR